MRHALIILFAIVSCMTGCWSDREDDVNLTVRGSVDMVPYAPVTGEPVTVYITIRNDGSADCGPSTVTFQVDGLPAVRVPCGGIDAYGHIPVSFQTSFTAGYHQLTITIDADNSIQESEENDNVRVLGFSVATLVSTNG